MINLSDYRRQPGPESSDNVAARLVFVDAPRRESVGDTLAAVAVATALGGKRSLAIRPLWKPPIPGFGIVRQMIRPDDTASSMAFKCISVSQRIENGCPAGVVVGRTRRRDHVVLVGIPEMVSLPAFERANASGLNALVPRQTHLVLFNLPHLAVAPGTTPFHRFNSVRLYNLPSFTGFGLGDPTGDLHEMELVNLPALTSLPQFAKQAAHLKRLVFRDLPALTTIGPHFCAQTPHLLALELEELPALERIGEACALESSVKRIKLRWLPALQSLGESFCRGLSEPVAGDIAFDSTLRSLTALPDSAFQFAMITEVRLVGLPQLRTIGRHFAQKSAVRTMILRNLPALEDIGEYFCHLAVCLSVAVLAGVPRLLAVKKGAFLQSSVSRIVVCDKARDALLAAGCRQALDVENPSSE